MLKRTFFVLLILSSLSLQAESNYNKLIDSLKSRVSKCEDTALSTVYIRIAQYYLNVNSDSALFYGDIGLRFAQSIEFKGNISAALNTLGNTHNVNGNYETALEYYSQALEMAEETGDTIGISSTLNNIGNVYESLGDYNKAIDYLLRSLKLDEFREDKENIASSYNNIGLIYYRLEDWPKALEYYNKSLDIRIQLNDKRGMALAYNNIGIVYYYLDDLEKVIHYFQQSLTMYEQMGDKREMAFPLFNIGQLYYEQNNMKEALAYASKAMMIYEEIGDKKGITETLDFLGHIYRGMKQYEKAVKYHEKSLQAALEIGAELEVQYAYKGLSETLEEKGDYKRALEYFKLYKAKEDSLFNLERTGQITEMQTKYESEKHQLENEKLHKENQLQELENNRQRLIIYTFILGLVIICFFSVLLYRMFLAKKRANVELERKNAEILLQKEEIETQRDQIEGQRDQLQQQNAEILQQKEEIEAQRDQLEFQRDLATKQRDQIAVQNQEITDSIVYAERIQNALLPPENLLEVFFSDYFVLFRPRDIVSGDFYWTYGSEKSQDVVFVAVADCTGHGVPGAFMSMLGIALLNEIVSKPNGVLLNPAQILNELRDKVISSLHQTGKEGETKDGMDISLCKVDLRACILHFAGANNPLYVIPCASGLERKTDQFTGNDSVKVYSVDEIDGSSAGSMLVELKPDKMPIGIYNIGASKDFTHHEITIQSGDQFYMFSDGFADQFGGPSGRKLKYVTLRKIILKESQNPMSLQKNILETNLQSWMEVVENNTTVRYEQLDDICVMGVKIK